MTGAPRSKEFDDVYFSASDGLAETRHVFLDHNNLPGGWKDKPQFTIAETGFGTGLNFLAAWRLFAETARLEQRLHFISFEKYPLVKQEIVEYLARWRPEFPDKLERMLEVYPDCTPGRHELALSAQVMLTLIIGDVNDMVPGVSAEVDCWFLDGFKPSANPEMWSETVFTNMARLSKPGASFATFTAAGFVKRGLQDAGFEVRKVRGYGSKRDMLCGIKI